MWKEAVWFEDHIWSRAVVKYTNVFLRMKVKNNHIRKEIKHFKLIFFLFQMNPWKLDANFPLLPVLWKFGFQIKEKTENNTRDIIFHEICGRGCHVLTSATLFVCKWRSIFYKSLFYFSLVMAAFKTWDVLPQPDRQSWNLSTVWK